MIIQALLLTVSVFFSHNSKIPVPETTNNHIQESSIVQDSLPPLHTISTNDILTVSTSRPNASITVTLKNGTVYIYRRADWDYEDYYPSTDKAIIDAINSLKITFTKTEHEPEFPGGDDAWNYYLHEFCLQHQHEIRKHGPAEFTAQFIVHIHGQVSDVHLIAGGTNNKLSSLAIECIEHGPVWLPALQNGHKVPCYKTQTINLAL